MTPAEKDHGLRGAARMRAYLSNAAIRTLIAALRALPYRTRVRLMGALAARVIGPLSHFRKRALRNLAHVYPDMPHNEALRIANASLNNTGRTLIENYSGADFAHHLAGQTLRGEGFSALQEASAQQRPVILVGGHFGNYEAVRVTLHKAGFDVGGLYRPMRNPYFNVHYVKTMARVSGPVFAQGRQGTAGFVRHLRAGGQLVLLLDQHVFEGEVFDFMGQPARTSLSAAKLALKFNALLVPFYGIRRSDGFGFDTVIEAPIAHSNADQMTQAINDSLAAQVHSRPEQWFWIHRRWRVNDV